MESLRKGETVIATPRWFIGLRIAQIIVALIIVALSGAIIHGYYADASGVAIASGIFTWIVALYAILTEHSAACRSGYNTWAILSLDFFLSVLWLASLGANAAFRASFVVPVNADCYDDGSAINAGHCVISKRTAVANATGRALISAVAGVSAIMLILHLITFAYVAHFFRLEWAKYGSDEEKVAGAGVPVDQTQAYVGQQQQQQPQWAQQQHQPTTYASPAPAYDPYMQPNTAYAGAQGAYQQPVPQQGAPEFHSPQGTPAPGQPYYPPQ
ncbi:hypothetical protein GGS24DRAFT_393853 [Hypoxylon argillaceum]|nr:hypothetical protein GGS24DRAFT_393853 [Hypoxylon argillaceum]KAI1153359.1 hypothetical protein F4825DRAFT_266139 [Nemania diffusa]